MSPEQVRGLSADRAQRHFSLGCCCTRRSRARPVLARDPGDRWRPSWRRARHFRPPSQRAPASRRRWACPREGRRRTLQSPVTWVAAAHDSGASESSPRHPVLRRGATDPAGRGGARAGVLRGGGLWARDRGEAWRALRAAAGQRRRPELDYLADASRRPVIHSLSRLPGVRVMARSTSSASRTRTSSHGSRPELQVDAVLTGSVAQRGELVTVETELVEVASGSRLWGDRYEAAAGAPGRAADDRPRGHASVAGGHHAAERDRLALHDSGRRGVPPVPRGALQAGRRTEDGFRAATALFQRALERDPAYASAWSARRRQRPGRSLRYAPPPRHDPARSAAERALELTRARPRRTPRWPWWRCSTTGSGSRPSGGSGAPSSWPGYATAHHCTPSTSWPWVAAGGARRADTSRAADPLSPIIVTTREGVDFARRHRAVARYRKVLAATPTSFRPRKPRRRARGAGRFEEARTELESLRASPTPARLSLG